LIPIDKKTLQLIFNAIRKSFKISERYIQEITRYKSKKIGPRGGERFECCVCNGVFIKAEIEMDHFPDPVVPFGKRWYELTVQDYYERVFVLPVRALCKSCHKKHTKEQTKKRKEVRK
jgi:5-methylcytosine-specific restriction endonuclease McrA